MNDAVREKVDRLERAMLDTSEPPVRSSELVRCERRSRWATRYRIVTDAWNGFEVQEWRWWFPIWSMPATNTSPTVEEAEAWLARYLERKARMKFGREVVKYL